MLTLIVLSAAVKFFPEHKRLSSSIWPLVGIQTRTNSLDQSGPESNDNQKYSTFPKDPGLEPHHQMVSVSLFNSISTYQC